MNWLISVLVLPTAFLCVFIQATEGQIRFWLGTQLNLLPALVVYASLRGNFGLLALVSLLGGFWFDSLSANPLGISTLPLLVVGLTNYLKRDLIMRDQFIAQFVLGLAASAAVPVLTLVLLLSAGHQPLLGWGSLWQWTVLTLTGACLTPICFYCLDHCTRALSYRPFLAPSFRADREIRRGRF